MGLQDRSAWVREALERFEGPLVAYATHLLGDPHAARDVVQDAFLRLVRADEVEVGPIVSRWLYTVVRHRAVDWMRRRRTAAATDSDALQGVAASAGAPPEDAVTMREDVDRVRHAMSTLSAGHQEVLRLRLSHGLSYADIAKVTGLSTSHVGVKIHEGMKVLRARLGVEARRAEGGVL